MPEPPGVEKAPGAQGVVERLKQAAVKEQLRKEREQKAQLQQEVERLQQERGVQEGNQEAVGERREREWQGRRARVCVSV